MKGKTNWLIFTNLIAGESCFDSVIWRAAQQQWISAVSIHGFAPIRGIKGLIFKSTANALGLFFELPLSCKNVQKKKNQTTWELVWRNNQKNKLCQYTASSCRSKGSSAKIFCLCDMPSFRRCLWTPVNVIASLKVWSVGTCTRCWTFLSVRFLLD